MKSIYTYLVCYICEKKFIGRKPSENVIVICQNCQIDDILELIEENSTVPATVVSEIENGGGEI